MFNCELKDEGNQEFYNNERPLNSGVRIYLGTLPRFKTVVHTTLRSATCALQGYFNAVGIRIYWHKWLT